MGRFLAIDHGEKRIGLAISDPNKIISKPLKTLFCPFSAPFHPLGTSMSGIDAELHPESDFPGPGARKRQIGPVWGDF